MSIENTKTFKIRKTLKVIKNHEMQEQLDVLNLKDVFIDQKSSLPEVQNQRKHSDTVVPEEPPFVVAQYMEKDQNINCNRFPHSTFCGCQQNCILETFKIYTVTEQLFFGDFVSGLKAKDLLEHGVTHILNITSKEYTKLPKYFVYQNIDLHDNTEEDAKKFFRLSNRFLKNAMERKGKVFIHCNSLQLGALLSLAFLIGVKKIQLKQGLGIVVKGKIEISPHFMKQIETYDLEKIAFISIQKD